MKKGEVRGLGKNSFLVIKNYRNKGSQQYLYLSSRNGQSLNMTRILDLRKKKNYKDKARKNNAKL